VFRLVQDLNRLYRQEGALHELDGNSAGFEWIDCSDRMNSVLCFLRRGRRPEDQMVVVANFTPQVRHPYRVGVPWQGAYREILNTDSAVYHGTNVGNLGLVHPVSTPFHGRPACLDLVLPPLALLLLKPERKA
jgi:1,4-alpha-glucan branching enzyme